MTLYEQYVKKFNKAKEYAKENHLPFYGEKYTKDTFKAYYEATRENLMDADKKATVTNVIKEMVDRQQYGASKEEGKALVAAMERQGVNITLDEARAYRNLFMDTEGLEKFEKLPKYQKVQAEKVKEFFDKVKQSYMELKAQGMDTESIKILISNIYFGSE